MHTPWQAFFALGWAILGIPLLIYAATRVRRDQVPLHAALMIAAVVIEMAVFISFSFIDTPNPQREVLADTLVFKVHVPLAVGTLVGMGWQLGSRAIPQLRPLHRHTGPWVATIWCAALGTGIYNFVFLYG